MTRSVIIVIVLLSFTEIGNAQGEFRIGASGILSFPISDFQNTAGTGVGMFATAEFLFDYSNFALVASVGYQAWAEKRIYSTSYSNSGIPIKAGVKVYFSLDRIRPYLQAEAGVFLSTGEYVYSSSNSGLQVVVSSFTPTSQFIVSPSLGCVIETGDFLLDFAGQGDWLRDGSAIGLKAGISFKLY
jgi:hypothetical protein